MKQLYKTSLIVYLLFLLWLVLFKVSSDPLSVLTTYQSRSLNLLPFAGYGAGGWREMIENLVVFVPLGLLLSINFKRLGIWQKLAYMFVFSVTVEIMQFVFAIGTTDVTDVIMNTLGGLLGVAAYGLVRKRMDSQKLNLVIVITLGVLLVAFTLLRFMVFRVRY